MPLKLKFTKSGHHAIIKIGDSMEYIKAKFDKYFKFIILGLIILIIIIIFFLFKENKYTKLEKEMLNKSKSYFTSNINYVTLEDMHIYYQGCQSYSGVYHINNIYKVYLFCNDYTNKELITKNITLKGNNPIVIAPNEEFIDPGYISNYQVEVTNNVNKKEGLYFINYYVKNNNKIIESAKRLIIVKESNQSLFSLKGQSEIYLFKGESYKEPGYNVDIENQNNVSINGQVDSLVPRTYEITYTLTTNNTKRVLKRKVIVLDLDIYSELENENPSKNTNTIKLIITGNDYSYTILPNGKINKQREIEYKVNNNGTYNFKIYSQNKYILKTIAVNNIYEDINASCTLTEGTDGQVFANVTTSGGYGELKFSYLDKDTYSAFTKEKLYYFKNKVNSTTIKIKDENNNTKIISCSNPNIKSSKLEIHFIASGHYDDSILIRTDQKTIYIDGGREGCKDKDITYLNELGVKKIDYMIGSHVDYDHIQAQAYILDAFPVENILYPVNIYNCISTCHCQNSSDNALVINSLKRNNKVAITQEVPSKIVVGDMTLYFIAPTKKVCNNNNNSFIFILKYQNNTFMFTGDSYSAFNDVETLQNQASKLGLNNINVDMLKYPHHGNETLYEKVLNAINPKMIIVPNYKAAKYPSEANKNLISKHNIKLYRQSDSTTGNITLISDGDNTQVLMHTSANDYRK